MARPPATLCTEHLHVVKLALAELAEAYKVALTVPSPTRIERYNAAQAALAATLHAVWACPTCQRQANQPLPLFPSF